MPAKLPEQVAVTAMIAPQADLDKTSLVGLAGEVVDLAFGHPRMLPSTACS